MAVDTATRNEPEPEDDGARRGVSNSVRRGQGRLEIIRAAAIEFAEKGYDATTIDDVADFLDATKGRIYHYFRSKEQIFIEVRRVGIHIILDSIEPIASSGEAPAVRMFNMAQNHAMILMTNLPLMHVATVQGVQRRQTTRQVRLLPAEQELMELRDKYEGLFVQTIVEGIKSGDFRECDPRLAAKAFLGSLNWITMWYRPRPEYDEVQMAEIATELAQFTVNALKA